MANLFLDVWLFDLQFLRVDFHKVIGTVVRELDAEGVRYALIGGFAMALRGVQRATVDLDFILLMDDLERADFIFSQSGYTRVFQSENVSHYIANESELGRIDILHAFRGPSLGMLDRTERIEVMDSLSLPVVQVEDIIGLKIQAVSNDTRRATSDWADIRMLLETSAKLNESIDWELLESYLSLFNLEDELTRMKKWHGSIN